MEQLVLPEALRKISSKMTVESNGIIPPLDTDTKNLLNAWGFEVPEHYMTSSSNGDYLVFLKATNAGNVGWLAGATFVDQGKNFN